MIFVFVTVDFKRLIKIIIIIALISAAIIAVKLIVSNHGLKTAISQNNRFNKVIKEEIKALETALLNLKEEDINKAIDLIYNVKGRLVVIGLGKSGYIGEKIAASFSSMGTPSYFIHATELFHGDFGRIVSGDVVLLL